MPELPEAETIARELDVALAGRVIRGVVLSRADVFRGDRRRLAGLSGQCVNKIHRRGKRVIVAFATGEKLIFGLGMSGRMAVVSPDSEIESHTHLRIGFDGDVELRFRDPRRFGGVWLFAADEEVEGHRLGKLGPEPLEISARTFVSLLDRRRQVKALLMDQAVIAGLGNIYADEALHRAGVHPMSLAGDLSVDERRALWRAMRSVLRSAINHRGTTLVDYRDPEGEPGGFQRKHRVYRRDGQSCQTCGVVIEKITAAGRSTHFCPSCQPVRL